jgi:hypothetical protein
MSPGPSYGLVLHDDDAPTAKPNDAVVGRWGTNASAVAVGKSGWSGTNFIVTTRHQGGGGSSVWFADTEYTVAEAWNHASADLRVLRVETAIGGNPNLPNFVQCYEWSNENNKDAVICGFGKGRGGELRTPGDELYGYAWSGSNNQTQRWGTNRIDSTGTVSQTYTSDILIADFDAPKTQDAALATWDSGGGWFIELGDIWYVAGLSRAAEHDGESWFKNSITGTPDPDRIDAVRISSYAGWINGTIVPPPIPGDANRDGIVDTQDFTILKAYLGEPGGWDEGDFNADGLVDTQDFTILKAHMGEGGSYPGAHTPGPATAAVLICGALPAMLGRKPRRRRKIAPKRRPRA